MVSCCFVVRSLCANRGSKLVTLLSWCLGSYTTSSQHDHKDATQAEQAFGLSDATTEPPLARPKPLTLSQQAIKAAALLLLARPYFLNLMVFFTQVHPAVVQEPLCTVPTPSSWQGALAYCLRRHKKLLSGTSNAKR